jgi:hypothetical protein
LDWNFSYLYSDTNSVTVTTKAMIMPSTTCACLEDISGILDSRISVLWRILLEESSSPDGNETAYTATSSDTSGCCTSLTNTVRSVTIDLSQSATSFIETPFRIATVARTAMAIATVVFFAVRTRRQRVQATAALRAKSQRNPKNNLGRRARPRFVLGLNT